MPTLPESLAPKRERMSRRAHKNSRDGCPNCRSKRIKCTEELPSCMNCVKKDLRCGYLDFPSEKLDVIRRKNEMRRHRLTDTDISESRRPLISPSGKLTHESDTSLTPSHNQGKFEHSNHSKLHKQRRQYIKIRLRDYGSVDHGAGLTLASLRSLFYLQTLKMVTDKMEPAETAGLSHSRAWNEDSDFLFTWDTNVGKTQTPKPASFVNDIFCGTSEDIETFFRSPNFQIFSPAISSQNPDSTSNNGSIQSVPKITLNHPESDRAKDHSIHAKISSKPQISEYGLVLKNRTLPNAIVRNTKFHLLSTPENLRNNLLERTVEKFRTGKFDLKSFTNDEFNSMPRPVWTQQHVHEFWVFIFHQAAMLNFYFIYFIDKSVNVLIRASDAVVNGDIDFASLPSTHSESSTTLESPESRENQFTFFYTKEDLDKLIRKSYVTYGRVIRELRESINKYHYEYPAKMSLYSAWSCYINIDADINTFCVMIIGTLLLLHNVLQEAHTLGDVSPALRQEIMLINDFAIAAKYPDYRFDIVRDLAQNFHSYQLIVNGFIRNYESGENFDDDLARVIRDPIFRHNYHELDKFFDKLQNHYHPKFVEIDEYYKARNKLPKDSNFKFVSPTLLFEMVVDWFRIYAGDSMSLNSRNNPLKKTLYLFYHALAKTLTHVFTPAKSVLLVDMCNVMATHVGKPLSDFDQYNRPLYASIEPLTMGLVKTIKFFENRLRLYSYYLEFCDMLEYEFITSVNPEPPTHWKNRDIVQLATSKVLVDEKQLSNLNKKLITAENIAFFPEIHNDPTSAMLIQQETDRQLYAVKSLPWEFNYLTGMLNHDFDPTAIINHFIEVRTREINVCFSPSLEQTRKRNNELLRSREVVKQALTRKEIEANGLLRY